MITGSQKLRDSAATGGPNVPIHQIVIERYQPIFTFVEEHGIAEADYKYGGFVDVITLPDDTGILKVYTVGPTGAVTITSRRKTGASWSAAVVVTASQVSIMAGIRLVNSGATIRCFWVGEADNLLHYNESSDGGASWGADQNVGACSSTTCVGLGATAIGRVHHMHASSGILTFNVYVYSGGWATTAGRTLVDANSALRVLDAVEMTSGPDLLVFLKDMTLWGMTYSNGRWGEPYRIGVPKDAVESTDNFLSRCELSLVNGIYVIAYLYTEGSADDDDNWQQWFARTAFIRSKDGRWWTHPEITPHLDVTKAVLHAFDDDLYLVGVDELWISDLTQMFEYENVALQEDISDYVKSWALSEPEQGVALGSTLIENDNGHFDDHAILSVDNKVMLTRRVGYTTADGDELVTRSIEEVDSIEDKYAVGDKTLTVKSRDRGKWLRDTQATDEIFLLSGLTHYDNCSDLGKLAVMYGDPVIASSSLTFSSDPKAQFALCTCGEVRDFMMSAKMYAAGDGDYCSLVMRSVPNPYDGSTIGNYLTATYIFDDTSADDVVDLIQWWNYKQQSVVDTNTGFDLGIGTSDWASMLVRAQGARFDVFMAQESDPAVGVVYTKMFDYTFASSANLEEQGYVGIHAWPHEGTAARVRADDILVLDSEPFYTLEDVIRALGTYAGILDFDFETSWHHDVTWNTADVIANYDADPELQIYAHYDPEESDPSILDILPDGAPADGWYHVINKVIVPRNFTIKYYKDDGENGAAYRFMFVFRAVDLSNFYYVKMEDDLLSVGKVVAGVSSTLMSVPLIGAWGGDSGWHVVGVRDNYVKFWLNDEFAFGARLDGTFDEAGYIGWGIYKEAGLTCDAGVSSMSVAELTNIVDFTPMSAGEIPDQVIRRAISQKHVQMWVRPDGSLRAVRPQDNLTSTFTYDHPEGISRSRDQTDAFSHIRVVGAWEWADVLDDTLHAALGYVFKKVDNSDLMSQGECLEECNYLISELKSRLEQVSFSYETMVLQEREDRITVVDDNINDDYRVSSVTIGFEKADSYMNVTARKYL